MAEDPWRPPPEPQAPRGRGLAWLVFIAIVLAGVLLLSFAFPGSIATFDDWGRVAQGLAMLVLVSTALLAPGRIRWGRSARHVAIWLGIVALLALGFTYREELSGVGQRVRMQFSSTYPVATAPHELVVTQGEEGHFFVMGKVNGQRVRFLVDTGASDTVLSPADARRLGIDTAALAFNQPSETANGVGYGAAFRADRLSVGDIAFDDVPLMVNQVPMSSSLLGMSFLRRLESFQVKGDRLYLKAKD